MAETAATHAFLAERKRPDHISAPGQQPGPVSAPPRSKTNATLDDGLRSALRALIERPNWPAAEFRILASRSSLMPFAVVKHVNEWSLAQFGQCVLKVEPDGTISVDISVNAELKALIEI